MNDDGHMPWNHTPRDKIRDKVIAVPCVAVQPSGSDKAEGLVETGGVTLLRLIEGGKNKDEGTSKAWIKCTNKERKFIVAFTKEGMSEADAYRAAYKTDNMKGATLRGEASRVMLRPHVSRIIAGRLGKQEQQALQSAVSRRRFVIERLVERAKESDTHASEIRALELLGKMQGVDLFRDISATPDDIRPKEEVEAEIEKRLKAAFGQGK